MSTEQDVLMKAYRLIEGAIYSEDGMDGEEGQTLLDEIDPLLSPEQRAVLTAEAVVREGAPES